MDPKIAARFNNIILHCARELYDIQADSMSPLDGFESFIYRFQRPDGEFILRIGHSGRRSPEMIHGEVDWINYLSDHGVTVARARVAAAIGERAVTEGFAQWLSEGKTRRLRLTEAGRGAVVNHGRLIGGQGIRCPHAEGESRTG